MLSREIRDLESEVRKLEDENRASKKAISEMLEKMETSGVKPKQCGCCRYFIQHYIKDSQGYSKTHHGHCYHGKGIKQRKPDNHCEYFEFRTTDFYR